MGRSDGANGPNSDIDSKVVAIGPSSDPIQREPADVTNRYGPNGIARAKGKDVDEGTAACVMDVDRGQVVRSEIV